LTINILVRKECNVSGLSIFSNEEIKRYSRHLILPQIGMRGQQKLKDSSVLLVGAGGLGSSLAIYLAAAGVGRIGLIDFDRVDLSNLQRQILYTTQDVGEEKSSAAAKKLSAMNPLVDLDIYSERLTSENALEIIAKYDIVADGTDNFPTRYLVNDACILLDKSNVFGSVSQFEGRVSVFRKGRGPCYRCLFPTPPEPGQVQNCAQAGILGVLPGLIGVLQATEIIKILAGIGKTLTGRLLMVDALDMHFDEINIRQNSSCPICGEAPTINGLIDYEEFCHVAEKPKPRHTSETNGPFAEEQISPHALQQALQEGKQEIIILDVRESLETEICKIEPSLNIPIDELFARKDELAEDKVIVVVCKFGEQSQLAVDLLKSIGFNGVYNLEGGLERWAREVDDNMPQY